MVDLGWVFAGLVSDALEVAARHREVEMEAQKVWVDDQLRKMKKGFLEVTARHGLPSSTATNPQQHLHDYIDWRVATRPLRGRDGAKSDGVGSCMMDPSRCASSTKKRLYFDHGHGLYLMMFLNHHVSW